VSFRQVFSNVFPLETVIAFVVFGLVLVAMIAAFAVSRHKRRHGTPISGREHLPKIEGAYVVALAGMAAFLAFTSLTANAKEFPSKAPKPAVTIHVTAFQWCWRFQYAAGTDDADADATVNGSCQNGQYPVLEVPVGERVEFDVTSTDVIHAFWVPYLDTKIDAFPDHTTSFTTTVTQTGHWMGRCAQYCGLYHSTMDFWLRAVPLAQYKAWVKAVATNPAASAAANSGTAVTAATTGAAK
jgi:cytochrome c oxidase subunit II